MALMNSFIFVIIFKNRNVYLNTVWWINRRI